MALTGLEIYKLLPKTNCGECRSPTCLAFAMRVAQKQAAISECPYVSEEAKGILGAASEPPIRLITVGVGDGKIEVGNETVLFRHDETFHHPTGVAISVSDKLDEAAIKDRVAKIASLSFERVGTTIAVDMVLVDNESGDAAKFAAAAKVVAGSCSKALILKSSDINAQKAALEAVGNRNPLVYGANGDNFKEFAALCAAKKCPLGVVAKNLDELVQLTPKVNQAGWKDLVIDSGARGLSKTLSDLTQIRRLALKKNMRPVGYPPIAFTTATDPYLKVVEAGTYLSKYAAIVVTDAIERWQILPLLTTRQNIFTDPRSPVKVEAGIHKVGDPSEKSPLLITTNFSLTYYTVEGDVEASKIPCNILVVDTEGTSVLTAWAADKFSTEHIAKALKDYKADALAPHKKLILPGLIAVESGALQDESGWQVEVGPRESSGIASYLRANWGG